MKWSICIISFLFLCTGCESRKQEEAMRKKETALAAKEQELLLKEKTLALKEQELAQLQQKLDSTRMDTIDHRNPALAGTWAVVMTCTETSCTGYAVGDSRTEEWVVSYEGETIIAQARVDNQLLRTYTGIYTGNTVELVENVGANAAANTRMVVRLKILSATAMEGEREITRENCKVIYALQMQKQK